MFALLEDLLARPSVSPEDAGCLDLIASILVPLGFSCERMDSGNGPERVSNLWAVRPGQLGAAGQTLVFAGHTDVVPTGPLEQWTTPPFLPSYRDGKLYARGASDMKGSIAAFITATQQFLATQPKHSHNLAFLLTSDEEGPAVHGTVQVCKILQQRGQKIDYCIVGEPTSVARTGDMVKNGRRGSLSGKLTVRGLQGHIAYPQLAKNPIHLASPALAELASLSWDQGIGHFDPTSWQMSGIHAGTGAGNVIPGQLVVDFNFRFSPASSVSSLQERLQAVLHKHGLDFSIDWVLGGEPFYTPAGSLVEAVQAAIVACTGRSPELSTTGGTSDGRFIAKICPQVLELGPPNGSIHKIDEHVLVQDLHDLCAIYQHTLTALLV